MKKYFKGLGIALVIAPFAIVGIFVMATGMICKAAGMRCLATYSTPQTK